MSDVESLVEKIPDWIHIYDIYKVEKKNIYDCVIKKYIENYLKQIHLEENLKDY